jgi:hypothetical protein
MTFRCPGGCKVCFWACRGEWELWLKRRARVYGLETVLEEAPTFPLEAHVEPGGSQGARQQTTAFIPNGGGPDD